MTLSEHFQSTNNQCKGRSHEDDDILCLSKLLVTALLKSDDLRIQTEITHIYSVNKSSVLKCELEIEIQANKAH